MLCSQSEVDACGDSLMTALWELVDMGKMHRGPVSAELGGLQHQVNVEIPEQGYYNYYQQTPC